MVAGQSEAEANNQSTASEIEAMPIKLESIWVNSNSNSSQQKSMSCL